MKKHIKFFSVLLVFTMIAGMMPVIGIAESTARVLLDISDNMVYTEHNASNNHELSEGDYVIEHIDYTYSAECGVTDNTYVVKLLKSTNWTNRFMVKSPSSVNLDGEIEYSARFKIKADNYSVTLPKVSFIFAWLGSTNTFVQQSGGLTLSGDNEETWQTISYKINTTAKTITGYLNGTQIAQGSYDRADTVLSSFGIYAEVVSSGATDLTTPVTMTFDSFTLTTTGSEAQETPKPTVTPEPSTEGVTLLNIDTDIAIADNASYNRDITSGDYRVEHIDWGGATTSRTVSADKSSVILRQEKSSGWQHRLLVKNPGSITLDGTVEFEMKFRLAADSYTTDVPKVMFMWYWRNAGMYLNSANVTVSKDAENTLHTIRYVLDPNAGKVTAYLDGTEGGSAAYDSSLTSYEGDFGLLIHVQNADESGLEGSVLDVPVTWTIDSFKVTKNGGGSEEPVTPLQPTTGDLLLLDTGIALSGNRLTETGSLDHYYWPSDSSFSRGVADNGNTYVVKQGVSTAYQQRFILAEPSYLNLDNYAVLEAKFKLKADNYNVLLPKVKFMFAKLTSSSSSWSTFSDMGSTAVLSADTEDYWQTIRYEIDYKNLVVTGYLNDVEAVTINLPEGTTSLDNFGMFPVVQNDGDTNTDGVELTTPITWTYDYIKLTKADSLDSGEEELAPALESPVSSGEWSSTYYEAGTGRDDSLQLTGKVVDLGTIASVNKVMLTHDSSKIMSFSVKVSKNGLSYTPVTEIYAGGVDEYSGSQIYRFAPINARYVKYEAVLMGEYETQAELTDMTVSYADTESIDLSDIPTAVNPADYGEIKLLANAKDSEGDSYELCNNGVVWSVVGDGAMVKEHTLYLEDKAGTVTVRATDASGELYAEKTISIIPRTTVRNFGLYSDSDYAEPLTTTNAGTTAYIKADVFTSVSVENDKAVMYAAGYNGSQLVFARIFDITVSADEHEEKFSFTVPGDCTKISAFVWDGDMTPISSVISTDTATAANLYLTKDDTVKIAAQADSYESSEPYVASVDENGNITAEHEGSAEIYAVKDGKRTEKIAVRVQATMYVYLLMGQSNMAGTNSPATEGVDIPVSENVKLLNDSNTFEAATHPYSRYSGVNYIGETYPIIGVSDKSTKEGINMGYSFSEKLAAEYPDKQIGLVVNSSSGCSILTYERNAVEQGATLANGFVNSVERMKAALVDGAEFKGIVWHQGESDQQDTAYPARLRNLIYDLRTAIGDPEVPFIAGGLSETNRSTAPFNGRMKNETYRIANMCYVSSTEPEPIISRAEITDSNGNYFYPNSSTDFTHFSATGQIVFGHRYYDVYSALTEKIKR